MHRRTRALALMVAVAAVASGCSATSATASPTVLTVQVADDAAGEAYRALLGEYDRAAPDVKIVVRQLAPADAREDLIADLGRGGLSDIVTLESAWLPEIMRYSDLFAAIPKDALTDDEGRWPDWVLRSATDSANRVVAYPAGIAPRALCYRADLLEAAGLPSDPDAVGARVADWAGLLQTARDYTAATGRSFLDSAASTFFVMMDELAAPFEIRASGEIVATTNPAVRTAFDRVTAEPAVFAGLEPGTEQWQLAADAGTFAASLCAAGTAGHAAVLRPETGTAPETDTAAGTGTLAVLDAAGWQLAGSFPGKGATSSASYFAVPAAGAHVDLAREVADWLTAPEQQLALFTAAGVFPSMVLAEEQDVSDAAAREGAADDAAAMEDSAEDTAPDASPTPTPDVADPFAAPLAASLRSRAEAITVMRFRGPASAEIERLMRTALTSIQAGTTTPADAWDRWSAAVDALT